LKQSVTQGLALFGEILAHPAFPEHELERLKQEHLAAIQREKVRPMSMALRVLPKLLFGDGHRYSQPLTGTGYESTLAAITREDIVTFYQTWLRPNNAKLIIVGDLTIDEATALVESALQQWIPSTVSVNPEPEVVTGDSNILYLLDRPGALQSIVIGGYLVDAYDESTAIATEHMNDILGGQFISRINLNLREDKHWTYGARSFILETKGQRPFLTYTSVQMDKTRETIEEIQREYQLFVGTKPVTRAEFDKNQNNAILALPGQWETNGAVADSLIALVKLGLEDNYFQTYPQKLRALSVEEVHQISESCVKPEELTWVVVGDKEKILPDLLEAGFQSIVHIDGDGNVLV
jgi:predicted Zn-dependent peptidase